MGVSFSTILRQLAVKTSKSTEDANIRARKICMVTTGGIQP